MQRQKLMPVGVRNFSQIKTDTGDKFKMGLIIYDGNSIEVLGDRIYAIPLAHIV